MNQKIKLNADADYENAHLVARDLVQKIGELLLDLPAPGNDDCPINWSHVGNIIEINLRLSSVVEFLESVT